MESDTTMPGDRLHNPVETPAVELVRPVYLNW
jgi:hypothetical protein